MVKVSKAIFKISVYFLIFILMGCALITRRRELATLSKLGASRDEIERYLERQIKLFNRLKLELEAGKLSKGLTIDEVVSRYGEPVLIKSESGEPSGQIFLYRHPTKYFSSDKIYLYFNQAGELSHWEFKEYSG